MKPSNESSRALAGEMAELISSADGMKLARLLRWITAEHSPSVAPTTSSESSEHIGIWQRKREQGRIVFARDPQKMGEWHHWANIGKIPSKGSKFRVVLLGESVARGYLYDPNYTPAIALAAILGRQLGHDRVEVIDLARTTISYEIAAVAQAVLMLEPDFVIMFCGNNWRCECPIRPRDLPRLSGLVSQYGTAGLKSFSEQNVREQGIRTAEQISSVYSSNKIPLLWIVPEFNLADWTDPAVNAPYLAGHDNKKWLTLKHTAETALAQEMFSLCAEAASEMIELDRGTVASGYYLLAKSWLKRGELHEARACLVSARDASIWDTSTIYTPRVFSVTQEVIRVTAAKAQQLVIDCPTLFSSYLNGGIPGRTLFLDYCHLTSIGIRLTMAATAAQIVSVVAKKNVDFSQLFAECSPPSTENESEAHFLASIHNAHWWQGANIVDYHTSTAMKQSPHLLPVVKAYVELQSCMAPPLFSKAAESIVANSSAQIQHYLLRYNNQQLDDLLINSLISALSERGEDVRHEVEKSRREAHAFEGNVINLLEYYYNSSSGQAQEMAWVTPLLSAFVPCDRDYYRAFSQESWFHFIAGGTSDVILSLTYRNSTGAMAKEETLIYINENYVARLANAVEWAKCKIRLPFTAVRQGVNNVRVQWPPLSVSGDQGIKEIASDLFAGRTITAYQTFGDIYMFDALLC